MRQLPVNRVWKRDGSVNVMRLSAAVLNVFHNSLIWDGLAADERLARIKAALLRGEELKTPLAVFRLRDA